MAPMKLAAAIVGLVMVSACGGGGSPHHAKTPDELATPARQAVDKFQLEHDLVVEGRNGITQTRRQRRAKFRFAAHGAVESYPDGIINRAHPGFPQIRHM